MDPMDQYYLFKRFEELNHQFEKTTTDQEITLLKNSYTQSMRHYHNLNHIQHMLDELTEVKSNLVEPQLVEMAIWYHDLIYQVPSTDNESKSADLARNFNKNLSINDRITLRALILSTKDHTPIQTSPDTNYMIDMDLAILGSAPERYAEYGKQIRKEYAIYSDADYAAGRKAVLTSFLQKDQVFTTSYFMRKYEAQAQKNIRSELATL